MGHAASVVIPPQQTEQRDEESRQGLDYTLNIPDECLQYVFHYLKPGDRTPCSLVCKRWYLAEGQSRRRLSLDARAEIGPAIPSLFQRFNYVSRLALRCNRRKVGINDDGLVLIGIHCKNLKNLKLRSCREITDVGMTRFAQLCGSLKKFSCGSCTFGTQGINAITTHCKSLEELTVKRLRGPVEGPSELVGPGGGNLKRICLKELFYGQPFVPLIAGSKKLQTLKLSKCSGDWDTMLDFITHHVTSLVEVLLERLHVSDTGLLAVSKSANLEILHLAKTPECSNIGIAAIANGCRKLRKLHIDGWRTNRIGDEGLIEIARKCLYLKELVLIGLNPTITSLSMLASNCHVLERLALCGSSTIGDAELSCIAAKCYSLKKLCIKGCPVSDQGMESLISGCPMLVKVKVKRCRGVTSEGADWLRANKGFLDVSLDTIISPSLNGLSTQASSSVPRASAIASAGKSTLSKAKLTLIAGGSFLACAFLKLSNGS